MPEEALERVLRKAPTILLSGVSLGEGMARAKLLAAWALNGLETWVPKPWVVLGTWVSCRKMQRSEPERGIGIIRDVPGGGPPVVFADLCLPI